KKQLVRVSLVGPERIIGEVKDAKELPEDLRKKLSGNKFTTLRPPMEDAGKLMDKLNELVQKNDLKLVREEEHFAWLGPFLMMVLPAILLLGLFFILLQRYRDPMGGGFLNNYIKSPARRYERSKMRVTFEDVADMEHAKRELTEVVEFLKSPEKF